MKISMEARLQSQIKVIIEPLIFRKPFAPQTNAAEQSAIFKILIQRRLQP